MSTVIFISVEYDDRTCYFYLGLDIGKLSIKATVTAETMLSVVYVLCL